MRQYIYFIKGDDTVITLNKIYELKELKNGNVTIIENTEEKNIALVLACGRPKEIGNIKYIITNDKHELYNFLQNKKCNKRLCDTTIMYYQAVSYYNLYRILSRQFTEHIQPLNELFLYNKNNGELDRNQINTVKTGIQDYISIIPLITNWAFTCEIIMKCLLCTDNGTGFEITHSLKKLFKDLQVDKKYLHKKICDSVSSKLRDDDKRYNNKEISLDEYDDLFVRLRYAFSDKTKAEVDLKFMHYFILSLIEACNSCKEIMLLTDDTILLTEANEEELKIINSNGNIIIEYKDGKLGIYPKKEEYADYKPEDIGEFGVRSRNKQYGGSICKRSFPNSNIEASINKENEV